MTKKALTAAIALGGWIVSLALAPAAAWSEAGPELFDCSEGAQRAYEAAKRPAGTAGEDAQGAERAASAAQEAARSLCASLNSAAQVDLRAAQTADAALLRNVNAHAAAFDGAVALGGLEDSANRTDFLRLIGFLVSPGTFTEDEAGTAKIQFSPRPWLSVTVGATEPKLRAEVAEGLDDDAADSALRDLDIGDDVTAEATVRLWPRVLPGVAPALDQRLREVLSGSGGTLQAARQTRDAYLQDPAFRQHWFRRLELRREWEALRRDKPQPTADEARELERLRAEAEAEADLAARRGAFLAELLGNSVARAIDSAFETASPDLAALHRACRNRLQVQGAARARRRDELIGADEDGASLTAQFGFPKLPRGCEVPDAQAWLAEHSGHPWSFAVEAAWTDKDTVTVPDHPEFGIDAYEELKYSLDVRTKLGLGILKLDGTPVGADLSVTANYVDPRGPAALDRWVANATLTFHLSDSLTVPLSVVYSDNQEFIEADEVRGKFGFSFSFDNDARTK
jgi:hypothetical protein